jgi:carbonic anhydrase
MDSAKRPTRRRFVRDASLAASGLSLGALSFAADDKPTKPEEVLKRLLEGNKRFLEGKLSHPGRAPRDFQPLAEGQAPETVIIGCADSRVAPEIIFDQGVGDLFVVRVAGNIVSGAGPTVKGSVEFAVGELGARLIMVLGHDACGACKAAITHIEANDKLPGSIGDLIDPIRPVVRKVAGQKGDKLTNVIKANVLEGVKKLEGLDPILAKLVASKELKIVGGVYNLATGKVEMVG